MLTACDNEKCSLAKCCARFFLYTDPDSKPFQTFTFVRKIPSGWDCFVKHDRNEACHQIN